MYRMKLCGTHGSTSTRKMGKHFPVRAKSRNFGYTGKVTEFGTIFISKYFKLCIAFRENSTQGFGSLYYRWGHMQL